MPILRSTRAAALGYVVATLLCLAGPSRGALLLTEIHYNGSAAGSDPDEFLELSNGGPTAIALGGYAFDAGIGFSFGAGPLLAPGESLVIARDRVLFENIFPGYAGPLFDFSGALSNSGERLRLLDNAGQSVWSVSYDDRPPWPVSADGGGFSLQLRVAGDPADPASWTAALPNPGHWLAAAATTVPAPATLALLPAGLWLLRRGRPRLKTTQ